MVQAESQFLASRGVQFVYHKSSDDKIQQRTISDYSIKSLGDKGSIALRKLGLFQRSVQDSVSKLPAGFPALQRFQTTDARITGCHRRAQNILPPPLPRILKVKVP